MRWPCSAAVTLLFLVTVSAQRGSRRFSASSTDNTLPTEESTSSRSHRFHGRESSRDVSRTQAVPRQDFPHRDAEVIPSLSSTRGSPTRASFRSRNEVSSKELHSRNEVPIVSSGAVEYERLQNVAKPSRRTFTSRGQSSSDSSASRSHLNEVEDKGRPVPAAPGRSNRFSSRGSGVETSPSPRRLSSTVQSYADHETTRSNHRSSSGRTSSRSSSQTESPVRNEPSRPVPVRSRESARTRTPDESSHAPEVRSQETTVAPQRHRLPDSSPQPERPSFARNTAGGRSLNLDKGDASSEVPTTRGRGRTSSRTSDVSGRSSFRSRESSRDEASQEGSRGSTRTSGRLNTRNGGEDALTTRGRSSERFKSRAPKTEDRPVPTEPPVTVPTRELFTSTAVPEKETLVEAEVPKEEIAETFASPEPATHAPAREIRTTSNPLARGAPRSNRGRGTARASSADLKSGGLKEKETDEVRDDDNYPAVYKQLKKSGTDPKDILVPKYKQILSTYVSQSKEESSRKPKIASDSWPRPTPTFSSQDSGPVETTRPVFNQVTFTPNRDRSRHPSETRSSQLNKKPLYNPTLPPFVKSLSRDKASFGATTEPAVSTTVNNFLDPEGFEVTRNVDKRKPYSDNNFQNYDSFARSNGRTQTKEFHVSTESSDYIDQLKYIKNRDAPKVPRKKPYQNQIEQSRVAELPESRGSSFVNVPKSPNNLDGSGKSLKKTVDDWNEGRSNIDYGNYDDSEQTSDVTDNKYYKKLATPRSPVRKPKNAGKSPDDDRSSTNVYTESPQAWVGEAGVVHNEYFDSSKARQGNFPKPVPHYAEEPVTRAVISHQHNTNFDSGRFDFATVLPPLPVTQKNQNHYPNFENPSNVHFQQIVQPSWPNTVRHIDFRTSKPKTYSWGDSGSEAPSYGSVDYSGGSGYQKDWSYGGSGQYSNPGGSFKNNNYRVLSNGNPNHDSRVAVNFNRDHQGHWGVDYSLENSRYRNPNSFPRGRSMSERSTSDGVFDSRLGVLPSRDLSSIPTHPPVQVMGRTSSNPQNLAFKSQPLHNWGGNPSNVKVEQYSYDGSDLNVESSMKPRTKQNLESQHFLPILRQNPSKGRTEFDVSKSNAVFERTYVYRADSSRPEESGKCSFCYTSSTPSSQPVAYSVTLNGRTFHKVDKPTVGYPVDVNSYETTKRTSFSTTARTPRNPVVSVTPGYERFKVHNSKSSTPQKFVTKPTPTRKSFNSLGNPYSNSNTIQTTTKKPSTASKPKPPSGNWNPYKGLQSSKTKTSTPNSFHVTKYEITTTSSTTSKKPFLTTKKPKPNTNGGILRNLVSIFRQFIAPQ